MRDFKDYTNIEPIVFKQSGEYLHYKVYDESPYSVFEQRDRDDVTRLACYEIRENNRFIKCLMTRERVEEVLDTL